MDGCFRGIIILLFFLLEFVGQPRLMCIFKSWETSLYRTDFFLLVFQPQSSSLVGPTSQLIWSYIFKNAFHGFRHVSDPHTHFQ